MPDIADVIDLLRSKGFVREIDRILSCKYEASREIYKAERSGKTLLFKVDCSPETAVVSNIISSRDIIKILTNTTSDEDLYRFILESMRDPMKPDQEYDFNNYYREIPRDITTLPALYFYEKDAGRYFTSSIIIARDPSKEIYNASIHRILVLDRESCVARIVPRHLYRIVSENRRAGRETPIAVCFSPHPLVELASALSPEYGVFELYIANRMLGGSLKICRTPIHRIPVPCECSHVIEARITLEDVEEGPFADVLMTYDSIRREPLIRIDSLYASRKNLPFHVILSGGIEHQILMGLGKEAEIYNTVSKVVRRVRKVRLTRGSGGWLHVVISIEKNHDGDGKNAILAAFTAHPSAKMVIAVDSDIDPDDMEAVEWAVATRFQASKGLIMIPSTRLSSLDPSSRDGLGDKLGIDATLPISDRARFERARIPGEYHDPSGSR
ncbi:MAG: UbiD family decarboxylase [Sulfolobales archaeon]